LDGIGRLLALDAGHEMSVADIQRLTRASSVQQLATENSVGKLDEFVYELISRWLEMTSGGAHEFCFSAYLVRGEKATSEWLKLQTGDKFLLAVELDEARAKKLNRATFVGCRLLSVQDLFNDLYRAHDNLRQLLKKVGTEKTLESASRLLSAAHKRYGMDELRELRDSIEEVMRHTW
jgi:hypothetical protein